MGVLRLISTNLPNITPSQMKCAYLKLFTHLNMLSTSERRASFIQHNLYTKLYTILSTLCIGSYKITLYSFMYVC